jgi:hypothetical protein
MCERVSICFKGSYESSTVTAATTCEELAIASWKSAFSLAPNSPAARGAPEKLMEAKR